MKRLPKSVKNTIYVYDKVSKYYIYDSVDFVDNEEIKAKKIAKERERKIDLILS